ncbi:MAG: hypothetical protein ACRESE_05410 [Gammaproteobacteria bacterium]
MARYSWLLAIALLFTASAYTANPKPVSPPPQKVDPELLEFLGSWQASDGQWVDPLTFARVDPNKLTEDKAHPENKTSPPAKQAPPNLASEERSL